MFQIEEHARDQRNLIIEESGKQKIRAAIKLKQSCRAHVGRMDARSAQSRFLSGFKAGLLLLAERQTAMHRTILEVA